VLRDLVLKPPPNVVEGGLIVSLPELIRAGSLARRLGGLSLARKRVLLDLFTQSAADFLGGWFESDSVRAVFGFDSIVGAFASPQSPGTAYVQLHHCFGEANGKKGIWGHALGGMGSITQAMAKACRDESVDIETSAAVREIIVERGRAQGVTLADGRSLRAKAVVSNLNPKLLFAAMVPEDALPADFLTRIKRWNCGSGTFRMNVALSELPSFTCLPAARSAIITHPASSLHRPSLIWIAPIMMPANSAGAASRSSKYLSPRRSIHRWRPPALMSRACSASTWRLSYPMAPHGMIIARKSPI
jgi:phytoene dehydrogenase-like protein